MCTAIAKETNAGPVPPLLERIAAEAIRHCLLSAADAADLRSYDRKPTRLWRYLIKNVGDLDPAEIATLARCGISLYQESETGRTSIWRILPVDYFSDSDDGQCILLTLAIASVVAHIHDYLVRQ